jgi:hypothetical protein
MRTPTTAKQRIPGAAGFLTGLPERRLQPGLATPQSGMGWSSRRSAQSSVLPRVIFFTLLAIAAHAASPRFARLGSFEGSVEVQLDAADSWRPAAVNLPLPESARIRTAPAAKVEIELDDTSVFRMAGDGLAEITDYSRLSGGQLITVLSLDHGLAYFTGEPGAGSAVHLLVPGAQATPRQGCRIRLQALDNSSEIAIIEGATHFTMPSAEMDLRQGQSARVTVPDSTQFSLLREITPMESDRWSEQLDKAEAQAPASRLDLDRSGKWVAAGDYGTVWQPAPQPGWAPFRQGRWIWLQPVGYTWVGTETWGWKPYHEGRWLQHPDLGWVWIPAAKTGFSPGDVFWARTANVAAWGPLAPGEQWNGAGPPRQFTAFNVTGGTFLSGAREILPSPAEDLPKDLLKAFLFTAALPSPPLPLGRLTAPRVALRTRLYSSVDVAPAVPEVTEEAPTPLTDSEPLNDIPAPVQPSPAPTASDPYPDPPPDGVYPAPVYPGVIVAIPTGTGSGGGHGKTTTTTPVNGIGTTTSGGGSSTTTSPSTTTHRTMPVPRPDRPEKAPPVEVHRIEAKAAPVSAPSAPVKVEAAKTDSTSKTK